MKLGTLKNKQVNGISVNKEPNQTCLDNETKRPKMQLVVVTNKIRRNLQ